MELYTDEFGDGVWISITQGKRVLVLSEDYEIVSCHKWSAHTKGYAVRRLPGETRADRVLVFLHRWLLSAPQGVQVDHANGHKWDCRRTNLRYASPCQNQQNMGLSSANTTGYKGVSFDKRRNLYSAEITAYGVRYRLGRFSTAELAARAYDKKAIELHEQFARLNFPTK